MLERWRRAFQRSEPSTDPLVIGKRIGGGTFASVHACTYHDQPCAAKVVRWASLAPADRAMVESEAAIWRRLRHPHVCELIAVVETVQSCTFVCERLDETLRDRHCRLLRLGCKPRMVTITRGMIHISDALSYLHACGVMHRDVKSENVLIRVDDAAGDQHKLSDFGLAKSVDNGNEATAETGSYRFMAPEVIRHEPYDERCDVYSLGMLFFEMLTLTVPFSAFTPVQAALAVANEALRPPLPPLPMAMRSLVHSCWQQDRRLRPDMSSVRRQLDGIVAMNLSFSSLEMSHRLVRSTSDGALARSAWATDM